MIRSGRLRDVFELQLTGQTTSRTGGSVVTYATEKTIRGGFVSRSGSEGTFADQIRATASQTILVRYDPLITPKQRLVHRDSGRKFNIESVVKDREINHEMTLQCTEVVE